MTRSESGRYVPPVSKSRERRRRLLWSLPGLAVFLAAVAAMVLGGRVRRHDEPPSPEVLRSQLAQLDAHARQGRLPEAIDVAQAVLRVTPDDDQLRQRLTHWLFSVGRFEEASAECRRCLERRPDNLQLRYLLADLCHNLGDNREAEQHVAAVLRAYPTSAPALTLRGALDLEAGRPEQAIPALQQALAHVGAGQRRTRIQHYLAQALHSAGRATEAKQVLAELQQQQAVDEWEKYGRSDSPAYRVSLAEALLRTGHTKEAVELLERVLAQAPDSAAAHRVLAQHLDAQGQSARAAEHRRRAGD